MAGPITFDVAAFRLMFPEFAATPPNDATLTLNWATATVYISDRDYGCAMLNGKARVLALNQLTAHITKLAALIAAGETPAVESAATIDKVSVTVAPPPVKNQFSWWLLTTAYGAALLALLQGKTAGGFYTGGGAAPERGGFRTAGGVFGGGGAWPR